MLMIYQKQFMITNIDNYIDRLHEKYPLISKPHLKKLCVLFLKQFVKYTKFGFYIDTMNKDFYFSTTFDAKNIGSKNFILNKQHKRILDYKKLVRLMIINEKSNNKYISRRSKSR